MTETVDSALTWARQELGHAPEAIQPREARLLLGLVLEHTEVQLLTRPEKPLTEEQWHRYQSLVKERASGCPFAYLAKEREFYGRPFFVDPRVLIPRPETEHLIDAVVSLSPTPKTILDVGTGSGCIAVTLALELPEATVTGIDVSVAALAVAHRNQERLIQTRGNDTATPLRFVASDWLGSLSREGIENFDTIVSNPPYISTSESLPETVQEFEPHLALFAGDDGLAFYRRLVGPHSPLRVGQRVVLELGANQCNQVRRLAEPRFRTCATKNDLAGWQRVLVLQRTQE